MRLPFFSLGMLLALSLIVTGCNKDTTETPIAGGDTSNANSPIPPKMQVTSDGPTSHPSQETVKKFLTALLEGNTQGTVALLTPLAQAEYAKNSFSLNSLNSFTSEEFQEVEFRLAGSDLVSENDPNYFGVYVNVIINNDTDESVPTVWLVRKIINGYNAECRVAGMLFVDNETGKEVAIDFEGQVNPDGTPVQQQMTQQQPNMNPQQTAQPNTPILQ